MMSTTLELRMSGTFSLNVRPSTVTRSRPDAVAQQLAHALLRDVRADVVVDAAAGEDDLRVVAELLAPCTSGSTDRRRCSGRRPGPGGTAGSSIWCRRPRALRRVDAEPIEDRRELVHQRDVEVALGVLDDLGGFGDLDRRRAVDAGLDDRAVDVGDALERCARPGRTTTFMIVVERVLLVARD